MCLNCARFMGSFAVTCIRHHSKPACSDRSQLACYFHRPLGVESMASPHTMQGGQKQNVAQVCLLCRKRDSITKVASMAMAYKSVCIQGDVCCNHCSIFHITDLAGEIASRSPFALQHAAILFTKSCIQESTFCAVT